MMLSVYLTEIKQIFLLFTHILALERRGAKPYDSNNAIYMAARPIVFNRIDFQESEYRGAPSRLEGEIFSFARLYP